MGLCRTPCLSYSQRCMNGFFSSLFTEMGARRRRMRAQFGDRGQAIFEFVLLGGLVIGSLGLLLEPWMPAAAPWGFALPFVFVLGYLLIDSRRQRATANAAEPKTIAPKYDWTVVLWSLACALAGAAAFVIAWTSRPVQPDHNIWTPPENAVSVEMSP